ncbi:MAG: D-alanyl-D-alanine carboxypeptidase/D-alanyl-D-alanine-endopeptidase [Gemmatimonadetes bacterium]|nr:D-alanyl-D-alanine carboxypeptidase/D-alanyl-D-alanine-endopeptidase [Gemmatimonadota bacterium]
MTSRARAILPLLPLLLGGCAATRSTAGPSPAQATRGANAALTGMIDSMVNTAEFRNANWGVLIVDPLAHDTLYSHNAPKLFMPASNEKIVTSSVSLEQLGPEFRFRTVLAARGAVADGTLNGDLAVIGRGDPTASNHMLGDAMIPLRGIADSLWQRGVRHITGSVVAAGDAFPGAVAGFGWPWDQLDANSFAGADELLFNEGLTNVIVRAGAQPGAVATAETRPARTFPALRVNVVTVARDSAAGAGRGGRGGGRGAGGTGTRVSAHNDTSTSAVIVRGQIAVGDSVTLTVSQHDPDAAYVAALTEALHDRGIAVDGRSFASAEAAQRTDSLFTIVSVPLREILPALMKPSQNQIAEVLLRTLGLERAGVGTADSGRRVVERQFAAWNIPADGYVIRDGSGLSRNDYLSPEAIVSILDVMRRSPNFDLFFQSLPIAGVDGTIRTRFKGTPAEGNLHAKTGTLSNARSLSGYVRTADGRLLEFSILCNNWTAPQASVDRVADAIGVALAGLR